jgi:hypothetical protein
MVLRLIYIVLSPVIGLLPPSPAENFRRLDASTEASGPHDFAVREQATSSARRRVHRIPPQRPVTFAKRPSEWDGTEVQYSCFYPAVKNDF